jgi:uncharacterized protein
MFFAGLMASAGSSTSPHTVAAAEAPKPIRIAFLGDSMSDGIWAGMLRLAAKEACLKDRFALDRHGENGTGLTRSDKFDWPSETKSIIEDSHPDLIVVSLGLNDNQNIIERSKVHIDYATQAWGKRYAAIASEFLQIASTAPAGVLWVGNPILRDKASQSAALERNRVYSEAIADLGNPKVVYVKPWQLNPAGDEAFQAFGPDASGSRVQIRAPDGIHFTSTGYDLIAAYLMPIIRDHLRKSEIEIAYPCPK